MDPGAVQQEFDPWTQPIILYDANGNEIPASMKLFDFYRSYTARLAITGGAQVGATITLLLVLLLLTRSEKRRSHIFMINALCLFSNIIRCILISCFTTSTIWNPYAQISMDGSRVSRGDEATAIAANVITLIVTALVMVSLSMQVWVVCVTTAPVHRYIIMSITTVVACIATGFKAAMVIIMSQHTLDFKPLDEYEKLFMGSYVMQAIAIWLFSCVFTYKLGYAIVQRRKLKMPQFGPMQIVFIMGCQTMLIPAIFTCLQFYDKVPEFGTVVLTVVCIFLPLSAIWAGVVSEDNSAPDAHHRGLIRNAFFRTKESEYGCSSASTTVMDRSRQMSVCTCATKSVSATPDSKKKSMADYGDDVILIGREFGFTREEAGERV